MSVLSIVDARSRRRPRPQFIYRTSWMRRYGGEWSDWWELDNIYETREEFLEAVASIKAGGHQVPYTAEVWICDENGEEDRLKVVAEFYPDDCVRPTALAAEPKEEP